MVQLIPDPQLSFNRWRFRSTAAGDTFFDTAGSYLATRFMDQDERGTGTPRSESQNLYAQAARCNNLPPEARSRCLAFYGLPRSRNRLALPIPVSGEPELLPWTRRAPAAGQFLAGPSLQLL